MVVEFDAEFRIRTESDNPSKRSIGTDVEGAREWQQEVLLSVVIVTDRTGGVQEETDVYLGMAGGRLAYRG